MDLFMVSAIIAGCVMGAVAKKISCHLIHKRSEAEIKNPFLVGKWSSLLWMGLGVVGSAVVCVFISGTIARIEYMLIYFVLLCLSAVDITIRKIPNVLLLVLICVKVAALIIKADFSSVISSVSGFAAGWFLFTVPAYIGIGIGWGDVKLAAVAGFSLGWIGMFQAVAGMAVIMGIYLLYLYISRTGTLKTKVAMGPPLSLGIMTALLFPLTKFF